jgi:hypothetical protein
VVLIVMPLKTFQTKIVEKSWNIWKVKLSTENVDSAAWVAASKNRYCRVKSVYWSHRCQEIPVEVMEECAGGSAIQFNLFKESVLFILFSYLKRKLFFDFITRLGCSMLPTIKTSSRWGCQTALNGVSQRPVKLLWYMDLMPVNRFCFFHSHRFRLGYILFEFTLWFRFALLDIIQLQGVVGTCSQGVLSADGREKRSMNSFWSFRETNDWHGEGIIVCRRVSHLSEIKRKILIRQLI